MKTEKFKISENSMKCKKFLCSCYQMSWNATPHREQFVVLIGVWFKTI